VERCRKLGGGILSNDAQAFFFEKFLRTLFFFSFFSGESVGCQCVKLFAEFAFLRSLLSCSGREGLQALPTRMVVPEADFEGNHFGGRKGW
jgi:hypothetical protein